MTNRLKYFSPLTLLTLLLLASSSAVGQDTVFFSGFEYDLEPIVFEPADLNGATDQVGLWSGDEFPEGIGDILELPDSVGIVPSPYGGSLMVLDRPDGDIDGTRPNVEPNSDFTGSYFADLSDAILLLGAEVSFDVGTRRTAGNQNKDYDIIGRDSSGEESFHLRVGTNNNGGERLGVVTDGGATVSFDLPTVVGNDAPADIDNTGGFNLADGPGFAAEIAMVVVHLGGEGYSVDFSYPDEGTSGNANAYTTDVISYNGIGVDLTQIEFTYEASSATGRNSGYILDNVLVTGRSDLVLGDFNFDGSVNMADFMVMASNFHTGTDFGQGDNNFDGTVDLVDFAEFKQIFNAQGQGAVAAAVPEPSSVSLIGLAGVLLLRRRRRFKR